MRNTPLLRADRSKPHLGRAVQTLHRNAAAERLTAAAGSDGGRVHACGRLLHQARALVLVLAAVPVVAALLALVTAPAAQAARDIPVAGANVNDSNLKNGNWRYAIRFVLDEDTTLYRFMSGMKALGAGGVFSGQGSGGYGKGTGGTVNAQLVAVKADGTPDLSKVLAQETVSAQERYSQSKSEYGVGGVTQFWYFNMGGVRLKANTMYAMVYRNADPNPAGNYFSANSPTMKESEVGPNGRNNLDPNAEGAVGGLDAREAVAWSTDGGSSWVWGRQVGQGYYAGSSSSDDGTRLPWYAWQTSASAKPKANQPYYNYWQKCSGCTLTLKGSPRAVNLTEAGGYAPAGASVGVVTVTNSRTGQSASTSSLGSGVARGKLNAAVAIAAGDTFTIKASGTVYMNPADEFIQKVVGVGSGSFPFTTAGHGNDRAQVFATPFPWFRAGGAPTSPQPEPSPEPKPTPQPSPEPKPSPAPQPEPSPAALKASFTTSPAAAVTGKPVTLDASASTPDDVTCSWDLDNTTQLEGCRTQFTFRYANEKRITLTVRDSQGRTATAVKTITVGAPSESEPAEGESAATFTVSPARPVTGSPVTFDATKSAGPGAECSWDLDNTTQLSGCRTQFTFRYANTKRVTLTIRDDDGTRTAVKRIAVSAP